MKNTIAAALLLCCLGLIVGTRGAKTQAASQAIDAKALWQPGMEFMASVRRACASAADFGRCFVAQMQKSGASPAAIAFTRLTDNTGFMRDFRDVGRVDVAYVDYPFRANENQGCLLVNGSPQAVDVDNLGAVSKGVLESNAQYAGLAAKYPNITVFPGERSGTDYPKTETLPGGGQRFVVPYRLMDGCHACERVGSAEVAFDFDPAGRFLGRRVVSIVPATTAAARR